MTTKSPILPPPAGSRERSRAFCLSRALFGGLALCCALLAGCAPSEARYGADERGWPRTLRVGYNPPEEETERRARAAVFRALAGYLEDQLGIGVEIVHSGSYSLAIEAMRARKIDICNFGSFSYLIARQKAGAEPLVLRGSKESGQGAYRSLIITASDSGIETLEKALERAGELAFSLSDPASTSGHLVPRAHLASLGVDLEKAFGRVVFAMGHTANVMTVLEGKSDLAAVASTTLRIMVEKGAVDPGEYRVLWQSPWMPTGPIAIRGDFPENFKRAVREAYVEMPERAPEVWDLVATMYTTGPDTVYLPGDDRVYDYYREIASSLETMDLLD